MSARRLLLLIPALSALLLGACGGGSASTDRTRLIDDLSKQLNRGALHRYHADYLLADGVHGTISQQVKPQRTAFSYPGGRLVVSTGDQTSCITVVRPARCQLRPTPDQAAALVSYTELIKHGLISGPVVVELLRITSRQPQANVRAHDTTVAGRQATCLEVSGLVDVSAAGFTACVTADGILATFTGVVSGSPVDQALFRVYPQAPADAFDVPAGAQVVDHRRG
jgi:hypothetical protein